MRLIKAVLAVAFCLSGADASLRARYVHLENQDPALPTNNLKSCCQEIWDRVETGVWDGYDPVSGFDSVADDDQGKLPNLPATTVSSIRQIPAGHLVSAMFWVDSLWEDYQDAPFAANITPAELVKPEYYVATDAYFVMLFGQISIPSDGDWTFYQSGDDGGMKFWIDVNKNDIFEDGEDAGNGPGKNATIATPNSSKPDIWKENTYKTFTGLKAGKYKVRAWKWDHGQVAHAGVFWKGPGVPNPVPIPAAAFGERRQFGPPLVLVNQMAKINGLSEDISFLSVPQCAEVEFTASAQNMRGQQPVFLWDFDDGTTAETQSTTITHKFAKSGLLIPQVRVKRGEQISPKTGGMLAMVAAECGDVSSILFSSGSGADFRVAGRELIVPGTGQAVLRVFSAQGEELFSSPSLPQGTSSRFNLPELGKGNYILRIDGTQFQGSLPWNGSLR